MQRTVQKVAQQVLYDEFVVDGALPFHVDYYSSV